MFSNLVNRLSAARQAGPPAAAAAPPAATNITPTQSNQQPQQTQPPQARTFSGQDRSILSMSGLRMDTTSSRWSVKNTEGQLVSRAQATNTLENSPFTVINRSVAILDKKVDSVNTSVQRLATDFRKFMDMWLLDRAEANIEKQNKKAEIEKQKDPKKSSSGFLVSLAFIMPFILKFIKENLKLSQWIANLVLPFKMLFNKTFTPILTQFKGFAKSIGDGISKAGKTLSQTAASGVRRLFGATTPQIEEFVDRNGRTGFRRIAGPGAGRFASAADAAQDAVRSTTGTGARIASGITRAGSAVGKAVGATAKVVGKVTMGVVKMSANVIKALGILKPFTATLRMLPFIAPFISFLDTLIALFDSGGEITNEVKKTFYKNLGGFLGGILGMVIFTALGTALFPGIGTLAGLLIGAAGAMAGAAIFDVLGEKIGSVLLGEKTATQVMKELYDMAWNGTKKVWSTLSGIGGSVAAFFGFGGDKKAGASAAPGNKSGDKKAGVSAAPGNKSSPAATGGPGILPKGLSGVGKASASVMESIKNAAKKVGVDVGIMLAMAKQESGFDPNAKAGTSSASGLFQFITSTWNDMTSKYMDKFPELSKGQFDPDASAIAGALYIKENGAFLKNNGIPVNGTTIYASHFLGAGGARKLLSADPSAIGAELLPQAAAANKPIFYDKSGTARTVAQIQELLYNKVGKNAEKYAGQQGVQIAMNNAGKPSPKSSRAVNGGLPNSPAPSPPVQVAANAPKPKQMASAQAPTPKQQPNKQVASAGQRNYAMGPAAPSSPEDNYSVYFGTSQPNVSSPSLYG